MIAEPLPAGAAAEKPTGRPRVLLDGLARDADVFELVSEVAPLHPRDNTFPGEVFLHVAADALNWCRVSRADPLPVEGLRERFLPECTFRGRENRKLQYAVLAAAALQGGTDPVHIDADVNRHCRVSSPELGIFHPERPATGLSWEEALPL